MEYLICSIDKSDRLSKIRLGSGLVTQNKLRTLPREAMESGRGKPI